MCEARRRALRSEVFGKDAQNIWAVSVASLTELKPRTARGREGMKMSDFNKADLDNYITGHWGEDQFRDEPIETEDEGIAILRSALGYLEPLTPDEDEWNEVEGELLHLISKIEQDYQCQECSAPIKKGHRYCSRNCYLASTI